MSEVRDHEAQSLIEQTEAHMRECSELLVQRWLPGASVSSTLASTTNNQDTQAKPDEMAEDCFEAVDNTS